MKTGMFFTSCVMCGLLCSLSFARESGVGITIYNNDIALIRQTRMIELQKGVQKFTYADVAAHIEPTSVLFSSVTSPESVTLLEQNFEYDLIGTERLLEKYIDQTIVAVTTEGNTFSGKLLNARGGDVIIQSGNGAVMVVKASALETIEFPTLPQGLITRPTLVWVLDCEKSGRHESEITYLTKGIQWHAEYVALTNADDTQLQLNGWVSIHNMSGASYTDASVKLVAGDVHMVQDPRPPGIRYSMETARKKTAPQFEEKAFFEYHLYTLQRPATLKDRQIKQLSLFPMAGTKIKKGYTFDGKRKRAKVKVTLEFTNDQKSGLGMPLPAGKIRVYKKDVDTSQVFIGEDAIDHTPRDEKVRVYVGDAFDIVGERILKEVKELGRRSRRETVEITLRNHKDEDVTITVIEHFWGDWEFEGRTPIITKKDARTVEFEVAVPKNSRRVIEYTVLYKG